MFDRIDLLEKAVYKIDPHTGATLFDKIEKKILDMDIQIKANMKDFKEQVLISETKVEERIFKQDKKIKYIEGFEELIEINKLATMDVHVQLEKTITSIRHEQEDARQKLMSEIKVLYDRMFAIETLSANLLPQMRECESKVQSIEDKCLKLTEKIDETIMRSVEISISKWSIAQQEKF